MSSLIDLDVGKLDHELEREDSVNTLIGKSQKDMPDFEVPGLRLSNLNGPIDSSRLTPDDEAPTVKRRLISFRLLITMSLVVLLLFYIVCTQVPMFLNTNATLDYLQNAFTDLQVASETSSVTLSLNVSFALLNSTIQDIELFLVANSSVTSISAVYETMWMFVRTREILSSLQIENADLYNGSPTNYTIGGVPQTFPTSYGPNSINFYRTAYGGISALYAGWEDGSFSGCVDSAAGLTYQQKPPIVIMPNGDLQFASVGTNVTVYAIQGSQPVFDTVLYSAPYNTTARPWYRLQSQLANTDAKSRPLWSEVYKFEGNSENGMSLTYPINFCGNYTCFDGVVAVDITVEKLNNDLQNQLILLEESVLNVTSGPDVVDDSQAVIFLVLSESASIQNGLLVASSGNFVDPRGDLIYPNESSSFAIRQASYVVNTLRPYGSAYWNDNTTLCFSANNFDYIVSCTDFSLSSVTCDKGPNGIVNITDCFRSFFCKSGSNEGCFIVLALQLSGFSSAFEPESVELDGSDSSSSTMNQVLIITIALDGLLGALSDIYENINSELLRVLEEAEKRKNVLYITTSVVTFCMFVITVVFTYCLSNWVTRPLRRLRQNIANVKDLNFETDAEDQIGHGLICSSRLGIKDIVSIEDTFSNVKVSLRAFAKFVPATVVHNIINDLNNARQLHVQRRIVTIMFSDIRGFTTVSEVLNQRDLMVMLSRYLTIMTKVVEAYGGVVAEILGDGLVAFWNTPDIVKDHALCACACAIAKQYCMKQINDEFGPLLQQHNLKPLQIGIGIHTGPVLTGNIGSNEKMKFGCIGDTINSASRLEGLTKLYGVGLLCSGSTISSLPPDSFYLRELDKVRPKGKSKEMHLYEIISLKQTYVVGHRMPTTPTSTHKSNSKAASMPSPHNNSVDSEDDEDYETATTPKSKGKFRRKLRNKFFRSKNTSDKGSLDESGQHNNTMSRRQNSVFALITRKSVSSSKSLPREGSQLGSVYLNPLGRRLSELELSDIENYERALHAYQAGFFKIATDYLENIFHKDTASEFLGKRIASAMNQYGPRVPVDVAWDSTLSLDMKNF